MRHKRDLVLGVVFKKNCGAKVSRLEPVYDDSHIKDMKKKEKGTVSLDSCF
jgi:hypothetical protein